MNITQDQISEMLSISTTYYGKIERGEVRQNLDRLYDVCAVLGVPIEDIFIGSYNYVVTNPTPRNSEFNEQMSKIAKSSSIKAQKAIVTISQTVANLENGG